ncbi:hypothetical protein NON20_02980 [Synechocystis sp. B12]|nr:hypothetical protein NON20_02980 [Synechocystis sp. B12]
MSNHQLEERQEQNFSEEIASILDISYEELLELNPEVKCDSDNFSILISFGECSPDIRSKIEKHHTIKFNPEPFYVQNYYSVLVYNTSFFVDGFNEF